MELVFRFIIYTMIGMLAEVIFAVIGLKYTLGVEVERRVSKKYLEGFVSLYMIPIHGFGILFIFEPLSLLIANFYLPLRFIIWGLSFVIFEFIIGMLFDFFFKFYPWDFYEKSKYKIFKKGYSLWTYIPVW